MFYILYGPDDFSMHDELERIKDELGDRESLASNTTVFEGRNVTMSQFMDACMALPFLGSHRLIIVEGLLERFSNPSKGLKEADDSAETKTNKGAKAEWKKLKDQVGGMPPTTVLVLIDSDIKRSNTLLKQLSPLAQVKEFSPLRGAKLGDWIRRRVKTGGGTITHGAAGLLASLVGENLWMLSSEIEKLLLYTAGRIIEEDDVHKVVSYAREANVFAMVDALIEGRTARAASLLHQALDEGATAPYLLVMITRQLRLLVQVKELISQRCPRADIKSRLGISQDFILDKALEQDMHYSMTRLDHIYHKLLETDVSIKRGLLKGELALDLLVAELCA